MDIVGFILHLLAGFGSLFALAIAMSYFTGTVAAFFSVYSKQGMIWKISTQVIFLRAALVAGWLSVFVALGVVAALGLMEALA